MCGVLKVHDLIELISTVLEYTAGSSVRCCLSIYDLVIPDSSMVEHTAVNRGVVGSSPTRGAMPIGVSYRLLLYLHTSREMCQYINKLRWANLEIQIMMINNRSDKVKW